MEFFKISAAVALSLGMTATASLADPRELSFATYLAANSSWVEDALVPWTEWINERANGEFVIKVYAGGTLGRDPNQQDKIVRDGIADMTSIVPGRSPGEYPDYTVFELPGFARTAGEGTQALWNLLKAGKVAQPKSVKLISVWLSDPYIVHSSKPVAALADMKGQRYRVAGATQTETLLALGAVPQEVKVSETAEAISRGMLDGAIADWAVADIFNIPEVTNNVYNIPLGSLAFILAMNQQTYDSLSDDGKALLAEAGEEWIRRQDPYFTEQTRSVRDALQSSGRHTIVDADDAEIEALLDQTAKLRETMAGRVSPGLIDAYRAELNALRAAQ